jgi:hypothetical protein
MVYSLNEAWRVLIPQGEMIDLRPLSINAPLDIVFKGKNEFAGIVDTSPGIEHDIAADHAIEEVVNKDIFNELFVEHFTIAYYWKTVRGMVADIRKRWKDDVILEKNVIKNAYELFTRHRHFAQVRILLQMKLARYEKQG